ncbi:MAG: hypothetical protein JNL21_23330 [Myxococcales bacterium]|nr:hypothetical protein [Myxococcales bacterium]
MLKMEQLLKRLSSERVETVGEALDRKKDEWVDDLRSLLAQLRAWLADGEAAGTVSFREHEIELAEEDLGPYIVPALEIQVRTRHPASVHILPRGMRVLGVVVAGPTRLVGACGRVDMMCGPSRVILLRFRSEGATSWKAVLDDGRTEILDKDGFATALSYLLALDE